VFGQPAFFFSHAGSNAEGETFFPKEGITAVAGTEAPHKIFLWEVHDETAFGMKIPDGMETANEILRVSDAIERLFSHAGHDAHADRDVAVVGDLDAGLRVRGLGMTHHVRHDVHRAALHAAVEKFRHLYFGFCGVHPVVIGAGGLFVRMTDKGQLFGAGDVIGMRLVMIGVRPMFVVQFLKDGVTVDQLFLDADLDQFFSLSFRTVAPVDLGRLGQLGLFFYPSFKRRRHFKSSLPAGRQALYREIGHRIRSQYRSIEAKLRLGPSKLPFGE